MAYEQPQDPISKTREALQELNRQIPQTQNGNERTATGMAESAKSGTSPHTAPDLGRAKATKPERNAFRRWLTDENTVHPKERIIQLGFAATLIGLAARIPIGGFGWLDFAFLSAAAVAWWWIFSVIRSDRKTRLRLAVTGNGKIMMDGKAVGHFAGKNHAIIHREAIRGWHRDAAPHPEGDIQIKGSERLSREWMLWPVASAIRQDLRQPPSDRAELQRRLRSRLAYGPGDRIFLGDRQIGVISGYGPYALIYDDAGKERIPLPRVFSRTTRAKSRLLDTISRKIAQHIRGLPMEKTAKLMNEEDGR